MGKWLVKALKLAGCDSIHLVGHSAGFLIALEAANALGDKLKTLTAVASAAAIPVNELLIETAKNSSQDAADMMLKWGFGNKSQKGTSAVPGMQPIAIGRQIMSNNPLAVDLIACSKYTDGLSRATEIVVPSNVVLATEDKMTPHKLGIELAEALNAEVTSIRNTGHMLPMESPKASLDAIRPLITKIQS
jgi:pimeloyl-ACP methyl ester carboxylesterase